MALSAIYHAHILSATRTPQAPSIIQFRSGRYWFQLGKHTPQRAARAIPKAAHFHYRVAHIQGPRPGSYAWRDLDPGPQFRASQLRRRRDIAMTSGHRALCQAIPPVHLCGAGGGCSGIKPGLKRQHAPGVPVAARGSAHPRGIETNQHSFDYDFPAQPHAARARVVSGTGTPRNRHVHMPGRNIDWTNISMHTCPRLWFSGSHLFRFHMH